MRPGYRYVITHSPDERGINVALLYQRGIFKLLSNRSYPVMKPRRNSRPTRDILHVSGQLLNSDTLDVFVVHFPSRSGGAKASEPYRLAAAQRLKDTTDSLLRIRTRPQSSLWEIQRLSRQQIHTEDTESRNTAHRKRTLWIPGMLYHL